jgi:hypothetical protein
MREYFGVLRGCVFVIAFVLFSVGAAQAVTYTTIADGNWSSAATWSGGQIPPSSLTTGNTIEIRHTVSYNVAQPIINRGTIRIQPFAGSTARLLVPTNINVENYAAKPQGFYIINASFLQCRFGPHPSNPQPSPGLCTNNNGEPYSGTAPQAPKLSGTFKNIGGYVEVINADVEVAQDWTSENGGERLMMNSCLRTGQNYSISSSNSFDTLIGVNISIGWHTSGNFDLSDGTIHFQGVKIQLAGTSGNFKLNSGKAFGKIDYVTLRNHITNSIGGGEIFASSSLTTSGVSSGGLPVTGLVLDAYCVSSPSKYIPNGKFSGTQQLNCTLEFSTNDCQALIPSSGGSSVMGRVLESNGQPIRDAILELHGGELDGPLMVRTTPFGWFRFEDVPVGYTYILNIRARGYVFSESSRVITLDDDVTGIEFIAEEIFSSPKREGKF